MWLCWPAGECQPDFSVGILCVSSDVWRMYDVSLQWHIGGAATKGAVWRSATHLAEAGKEVRHWHNATALHMSTVQDICAAWHALDNRPLNKLRHRHAAENREADRALGEERLRPLVSARWLSGTSVMERHSDVLLSSVMARFIYQWFRTVGWNSVDIIEIVLHCGVCHSIGYMTLVVRMSLATTPLMLLGHGEWFHCIVISIPLCYLHHANNADFYFNTQYAAATLVESYLIFLCLLLIWRFYFLKSFILEDLKHMDDCLWMLVAILNSLLFVNTTLITVKQHLVC